MMNSAIINVGVYSYSIFDIRELYRRVEEIVSRVTRKIKTSCRIYISYGNYKFRTHRSIGESLSPIVHILISGRKGIVKVQKEIEDEIKNNLEYDIYDSFFVRFGDILARCNKKFLEGTGNYEKKWYKVKHTKDGYNHIETKIVTYPGAL